MICTIFPPVCLPWVSLCDSHDFETLIGHEISEAHSSTLWTTRLAIHSRFSRQSKPFSGHKDATQVRSCLCTKDLAAGTSVTSTSPTVLAARCRSVLGRHFCHGGEMNMVNRIYPRREALVVLTRVDN